MVPCPHNKQTCFTFYIETLFYTYLINKTAIVEIKILITYTNLCDSGAVLLRLAYQISYYYAVKINVHHCNAQATI